MISAVRKFALRTESGRARPLWRMAYALLARGADTALTLRQPGVSVYVAASVAGGDSVYGLSDIDLVIVAPDPHPVRRRWEALRRVLPSLTAPFSDLAIYATGELEAAAGASTLTHAGGALYLGGLVQRDGRGLRERPGLAGPTRDWRRLRGPELRPPEKRMDAQSLRIAAWLELQFWWRQAMWYALVPTDQHSPYMCFKLVVHSARTWLAIEHGMGPPSAQAVIEQALVLLPEEEQGLRHALDLRASLGCRRESMWDEALPVFVRLSGRVAKRLGAAADEAGRVEVRLSGAPTEGPLLPLLDWRGLVLPVAPEDYFVLTSGDPANRSTLASCVRASEDGRYRVLRTSDMLVLAAGDPWTRSFLRAAACGATDPVSFALSDGSSIARFPRLAGWSVEDVVRRAVDEHRAWLEQTPADGTLAEREWIDGRLAGVAAPLRVAAKLFTAARAAMLHESLSEGSPELAISVESLSTLLAVRYPDARGLVEDVAGAYVGDQIPDQAALRGLRAVLRLLPAFARASEPSPAPSATPRALPA